MCTVTLLPVPGGARLACNRDESRTRPVALPPETRRFGRRQAVLPIDPVSGGTWVAINDAGLALTLLNVNPPRGANDTDYGSRRSRGTVIPRLLSSPTLEIAARRATMLDADDYAPFRLILTDAREVAEIVADGASLRLTRLGPLRGPLLWTSSGLGDALVEAPRRQLFDAMVTDPQQQDAFHRHAWPDRLHVSVCMSRPDARTVNHTVIERRPDTVTLRYWPDAPDRVTDPVVTTLGIHRRAAS